MKTVYFMLIEYLQFVQVNIIALQIAVTIIKLFEFRA